MATQAKLEGGRYLADLFQKDSIQASLIQKLIDAINAVSDKTGTNPVGESAPPPPITYVNAKASGELLHVVLTHTPSVPVTRAVNYFVEVDNSPNFPQPHVFHLKSSRELITHLPTFDDNGNKQTYYVRGYAQYPGSKPTVATPFGGTKPQSITMGGNTNLTLIPSTGSGTAGLNGQQGGFGLGKYPVSIKPNPKSFKNVQPNASAIAATSSNPTLDQIPDGPIIYSRTRATHVSNGVAYNFKGAWSSSISYVVGDEVDYNSNYWLAVTPNSNSAPSTTNPNWQLVGLGSVITARPSSTTGISGTILNPTNAYDGLLTDFCEVDGSSATITFNGFPAIVFPNIQKMTLKVSAAMLSGFTNSGTLLYKIGSGGATAFANVNTTTQTTYSVDVSSVLNPGLIQVVCQAGSASVDDLLIYEIWIEESSF